MIYWCLLLLKCRWALMNLWFIRMNLSVLLNMLAVSQCWMFWDAVDCSVVRRWLMTVSCCIWQDHLELLSESSGDSSPLDRFVVFHYHHNQYLMHQLQSVFSVAEWLIFHLKSSNHITDAFISLHWLRVLERCHGVQSATCTCTKLPRPLVHVADVCGRPVLCSAGTNRILVPPVTSITVGSRVFPVAAPLIWNFLPDDVISAESLPTFQRNLKRHLFCQSFFGFCYWHLHL